MKPDIILLSIPSTRFDVYHNNDAVNIPVLQIYLFQHKMCDNMADNIKTYRNNIRKYELIQQCHSTLNVKDNANKSRN